MPLIILYEHGDCVGGGEFLDNVQIQLVCYDLWFI